MEYISVYELMRQSELTHAELKALAEARLLLPDRSDGRYRYKLVGWGRKLAFLLHEGWTIPEIQAWTKGRWKTDNPRQWPPEHLDGKKMVGKRINY